MYPIPGHLAMSLAGTTLTGLPHLPAIVATIFVDVVDKSFADVFHITEYGRCWFHTLLSVGVCSAIVYWWKGKEWALSWMLGHFLHLIGDIGFIPWFYPFISYEWPDAPNVVKASMNGINEVVNGTGFSEQGFSESVRSVFYYRLIMLETLMLASVAGIYFLKDEKWKRWRMGCFALLVVFGLCRIAYQFPPFITTISHYVGGWVFI